MIAVKQSTRARAKTSNVVGNVDRRQRDISTCDNGNAAMVDRQVVTAVCGCARSTTL